MIRKQFRRKNKWERLVDRFNAWVNEFQNDALILAALMFIVSALIFWKELIK